MKKDFRRIASHEILLENGSRMKQSVVEIQSGVVTRWYPLTEDLPHTEWFAERICLSRDAEGLLRARVNNKVIN